MKILVSRTPAYLKLLALCLFVALSSCAPKPASEPPSRLELSRVIIDDFANQLQSELMGAMGAGGPVNAIGVCQLRAPQIAATLSEGSGATVMRTSDRTRNPGSSPSEWQRRALQTLPTRLQADPGADEYYADMVDGAAHYMKAIYTKPLCLACHGESLSEDVRTALGVSYPEDQATGYEAGELRGAFSVSWPPES